MSAMLPILLRIDYTGGSLYFVNNTENVVYGGNTYVACAFNFNPPDQGESGITNASLTIDAVDGTIISLIRSLTSAPTVTTVAAMYNDTIESMVEWSFILRNVTCDGVTITGDLVYEERLENNMGPLEFTPQNAPAIF
jgi:hypothetical protein